MRTAAVLLTGLSTAAAFQQGGRKVPGLRRSPFPTASRPRSAAMSETMSADALTFAPFPLEAVDISSLGGAAVDFHAAAAVPTADAALQASDLLLSFSDQGNNLAGIFFQGSLPPYLLFLYFLNYKGNKTPKLMGFGFGFLLLFVLATIPTGLISKGTFECSLADVDWLHGAAESLLTVSNVLIVLGLREGLLAGGAATVDATTGKPAGQAYDPPVLRYFALLIAVAVAIFCGSGVGFGLEAHTPFLGGLGGLPSEALDFFERDSGLFPDGVFFAPEPENALSVPTWAVHFSSVFEFIFAMGLVWRYAEATGNEKWKGVTWGMLPSHASGVAACTYHFFFNNPSVVGLVTLQAGLTALGNTTLAIACWRLALSNGWTLNELNPLRIFDEDDSSASAGAGQQEEELSEEERAAAAAVAAAAGGGLLDSVNPFAAKGKAAKQAAAAEATAAAAAARAARAKAKATLTADLQSAPLLGLKLVGTTLLGAYLVKYGELALGFPLEADPRAAAAVVALPPLLVAKAFFDESDDLKAKLPSPF
jgi:hypothetical protein